VSARSARRRFNVVLLHTECYHDFALNNSSPFLPRNDTTIDFVNFSKLVPHVSTLAAGFYYALTVLPSFLY